MKTEKSTKNFMRTALGVVGYTEEELATIIVDIYPDDETGFAEFVKDDITAKLTAAIKETGLTEENLPLVLAGSILVSYDVGGIVENNPAISPDLREKCVNDIEKIFRESAEAASFGAVTAGAVTKENLILAYEKATALVQEEWAREDAENQITKENLRIFLLYPNAGKCELQERERSMEFVAQWEGAAADWDQFTTYFSEKFVDIGKLAGDEPERMYAICFSEGQAKWRKKLLAIAEQQFGAGGLAYRTLNFHFIAEKSGNFIQNAKKEGRH